VNTVPRNGIEHTLKCGTDNGAVHNPDLHGCLLIPLA
jgi:hypothetical protein